ncbi:hypothetical protein, variant 1 [Aphanomyces invadans]|uniref:Ubiquitin thioesterase OTU n=1 Tax=Aphanomyces invadans TaxID=157072 RepID=A0A024TR61_9STRA|nr:hypothetical protein, variant 1 [Aphanomyces invadans]ETV96645.1 hypothetical protein, variant 1 [Aphanomyces invadans]|eukprot:XP_008874910.1 hypothetical protein, variant 1 [Aphanomyces invadans]
MNLKVNSSQGSIKLAGLPEDTTLFQLKLRLLQETGLAPDDQTLLSGYPPKLIVGDDSELLTALGVASGSVVTLKEEVTLASTKPSSLKFVRKVIAADNSCLFNAIRYCLGKGDKQNGETLRSIVKEKILSFPTEYNETFLGRPVNEYCAWIMDSKSWGGEIELSILSAHFRVEMLVFDVVSMTRLCYGEDQGFTQRLFLLYDGIHYDAIAETGHRGPNSDKTLFAINDFVKVEQASVLAVEAHQVQYHVFRCATSTAFLLTLWWQQTHLFTDVSAFTIQCMQCRKAFQGERQAQAHANESGHYEFGEVRRA